MAIQDLYFKEDLVVFVLTSKRKTSIARLHNFISIFISQFHLFFYFYIQKALMDFLFFPKMMV